MPAEDLEQVKLETEPHLGDFLDNPGHTDGGFFAVQTKRVMGLVGKSKAFIEKVSSQNLFRAVAERILGQEQKLRVGQNLVSSTSMPQLSSTLIFSARPGASTQRLHAAPPPR